LTGGRISSERERERERERKGWRMEEYQERERVDGWKNIKRQGERRLVAVGRILVVISTVSSMAFVADGHDFSGH